MSDTTKAPARPVSLITIVFLFAVFAAFLFLVRHFYHPTTVGAYNAAAENLSKDLAWRATHESRAAALTEMREEQTKQLASYRWVDQKAGVIQLPIDRAMELTAEKYGSKK
jgi:F0F1-type ATP synthase membrane subunit b/b'